MSTKRIFFFLLLTLLASCISLFFWVPQFLSHHHPVSSEHILMEGWLPPYELEQAVNQLYKPGKSTIIVPGKKYIKTDKEIIADANSYFDQNYDTLKSYNKGIWLLTNSTLFFNVKSFLTHQKIDDTISIQFTLKRTFAEGRQAHIQVYINGDRFDVMEKLSDDIETVSFKWPNEKGAIQSLALQFDNDLRTEVEDRNVNVLCLRLNNLLFPLNSKEVYYRKNEGHSYYGFRSESDLVENYLLNLGVKESDIIKLDFDRVQNNQTQKSAIVFSDWAKHKEINSVNIISSGIHSRRSWVTYQRLLPSTMDVGVICFQSGSINQNALFNSITSVKLTTIEFFSYFINWVELTIL